MLNMKTDGTPVEVLHDIEAESKKRLTEEPLYEGLIASKLRAIEEFETEVRIMLTLTSINQVNTNELQKCLDNMTNIVSSYGEICHTIGNWEGKMQMNVLAEMGSDA